MNTAIRAPPPLSLLQGGSYASLDGNLMIKALEILTGASGWVARKLREAGEPEAARPEAVRP